VSGPGHLLPPQLHAASLHTLVDLYVQAGLDGGDLATIGPLRLLRDRVEFLIAEHAGLAHHVDGRPWREVGDALGVTASAMSAWDRAARRSRAAVALPRPATGTG
jgi:hypothetical protein